MVIFSVHACQVGQTLDSFLTQVRLSRTYYTGRPGLHSARAHTWAAGTLEKTSLGVRGPLSSSWWSLAHPHGEAPLVGGSLSEAGGGSGGGSWQRHSQRSHWPPRLPFRFPGIASPSRGRPRPGKGEAPRGVEEGSLEQRRLLCRPRGLCSGDAPRALSPAGAQAHSLPRDLWLHLHG